ncbi:hypothetical protein [Streptomyces sp. NPDC058861]|uniref:hypothetical protein n=1 Tax=Streptomyces sp. NPDC058861 TaxID=3346653 RepID=UPI003673F8AF
MTAHPLADQPRVLPTDPAWALDTAPLRLLLELAARAAEIRPDRFHPLHSTAYDAAAALLTHSAEAVLRTPDDGRERILPVPVYQLQALTSVRAELALARDDEPATEGLRDLLLFYGGYTDQTPEHLLAVLDRALAVLDLDTPAVHTVTLALLARRTPDPEVYEQITAAWKKAGVAP